MEGGSFFSGLVKGFGGGLLDDRQRQQQQQTQGQKELLNFFLKGIESNEIDRTLGYTQVGLILNDLVGGGSKGSKNALAALMDPENFGQFASGAHAAMSGGLPTSGKAGPTGLPAVGPAPMGRANAPEQRPQTVTPPVPSEAEEITPLSDQEEQQFQAWVQANNITDADHPDSHYDYRGYWKATDGAPHEQGEHYPDTFKQHGHPTFSVESQYSQGPEDGGHWVGDRYVPPLAQLDARSTTVGPPAQLRNTPQEQERLQLGKLAGETATREQASYEGRVRVADELFRTGKAKTMDEALTRVGLDVPGRAGAGEINARAIYTQDLSAFRQTHGRDPNPTEQRTMMIKALEDEAHAASTAREGQLTGDLRQRTDQVLARQNIDPLKATEAQRVAASKIAADALQKEQANPWMRSTRTATPFEQHLYGQYGTAVGATDPRQMLGPGVLTPQQVSDGSTGFLKQQASQQGDITAARERMKLEYQGKRRVTPAEAGQMQSAYGLTQEQAAALGRVPLTSQQANAVPATYAFERESTEALDLFKKAWPKDENPEARRVALMQLSRSQDPDFALLQGRLKAMPLELAVIVQGSRPSDTEREVFEAALPTMASDNWSLVNVPSSYAAGLALLERMKKVGDTARKDMGVVPAAERGRPPARPAPGTKIDSRGNIRDATGAIISGPDKPR